MDTVKITWKNGLVSTCQVENSREYLEQTFGHPTRFPDDVLVEVTKGENHASEEGEVEEGDISEHPDRDGGGEAAETGGGDSPVESQGEEG